MAISGGGGKDDDPDKQDWPCPWKSLSWPDYSMLGFTAIHQLILLAVVVHLVRKRDWPPYVTKNVNLVSSAFL